MSDFTACIFLNKKISCSGLVPLYELRETVRNGSKRKFLQQGAPNMWSSVYTRHESQASSVQMAPVSIPSGQSIARPGPEDRVANRVGFFDVYSV